MSKTGRYVGTFVHKDIAFEFGMWISPKFKLLLIKEFERLKQEEQKQIGWNVKRELSKINYRIHTSAVKNNLIPKELTKEENKDKNGNIRDYASIDELICLANLENLNSVFINDRISQAIRLERLNKIAISQMKILSESNNKCLENKINN